MFREIRAQGDSMESVVMIVNSIVGIQSNSSKGITERTTKTKEKSMWFLVFRFAFFRLAWKKPCQWYHVKTHQMNYKYVLKSKISNEKENRRRERKRDMVSVEIAPFFITFLLACPFAISSDDSVSSLPSLPPPPPLSSPSPCFHVSECLKSK